MAQSFLGRDILFSVVPECVNVLLMSPFVQDPVMHRTLDLRGRLSYSLYGDVPVVVCWSGVGSVTSGPDDDWVVWAEWTG